ncbi:cadherin-related family member 5 [Echeneis naucrates]|uniref:cadherin-related family member 5 n=1 Tax=Echeneis naucrates TaxID=173247 RepID=UPI001114342E|nr:cadherin-related family member 5-like [Echeneis naucrates]
MDGLHPNMRTAPGLLLLLLVQTSTVAWALSICSGPTSLVFPEGNEVGAVIANITMNSGVTLSFTPPEDIPNLFTLEGNQLKAAAVLDYETQINHIVRITCQDTDPEKFPEEIRIVIRLVNVNDNPPVFSSNLTEISVSEMTPVGTSVGRLAATDLDGDKLYYTLTSSPDNFELRSSTDPDILVKTSLDYDKAQNATLVLSVQDTPLATTDGRASFHTTYIVVTILDSDNRPPWFQPCEKHEIGGTVICQSAGYTGRVVLNELQTGPLELKPGPVRAIDGDSGINEQLTYLILSGNSEGMFEMDPDSGSIRMLKPATRLESMELTVMAAQKNNSFQFATTEVTISVQQKSLHPPKFQRPQYRGVIRGVGSMALDSEDTAQSLQILATDDDYDSTGGVNPYIAYSVSGSDDFTIVGGHLFMTKPLPDSTLSLQVVAKDTSNDEKANVSLSVEVTSGLTTSSPPLNITVITTTTPTGESTTGASTTGAVVPTAHPESTTGAVVPTAHPGLSTNTGSSTGGSVTSTESGVSTTNPSLTSEGSASTASTAQPLTVIVPSGGYGPEDMAALGATLGVLLLICLVVIGVLAHRLRKRKANWRKIFEINMFRNNLVGGSGGAKETMQYTNDAFENDGDAGSVNSGGAAEKETQKEAAYEEVNVNSLVAAALQTRQSDDTSLSGSDGSDGEKEVKPILTKERRVEDGYKAVWFKEDIDPKAKTDVVIIPGSREDDDSEEDNEAQSSSSWKEPRKFPKVGFADADLDSGLGVKMGDSPESSDSDEALTSDL